ncbi:MAG: hypothetical protein WBS24_08515 [Terriglobales bacterium]
MRLAVLVLPGFVLASFVLAFPVLPAYAQDAAITPAATPSAATPATASVRHHHLHKKPEPPPLALPPLPAGPLSQIPMDQLPEVAPKVTYENGKLAIAAQNATLAEILKQVRKLTGASIEIPPSGANERVVAQIGPGAPRDVLATLLNGTAFNYVMLGSSTDPASVASVMLTAKPGSGEAQNQVAANNIQQNVPTPTMGGVVAPQPFRQQMIAATAPPEPAPAEVDDNTGAEATDDDENAEDAQPVAPANDPAGQPNAGPRTPEQLLQMMRQGQQPQQGGLIPPPTQQPPQQ